MMRNQFVKRVLWLVIPLLTMFNMNAWGMTTSDISSSAATSITDGDIFVIATAYDGYYLTTGVEGSWGLVTTNLNDAAFFTAHGSESGFYLTCDAGRMVPATSSGNFSAYDNGSDNNLQLNVSGQILSSANTGINLRSNSSSSNKLRWYNGSTGNSVYLYKVTSKFTVTYDAGTGSCGTASAQPSVAGGTITLPSASPSSDCSSAGWAFVGWTTASCSATIVMPTLLASGSTYRPLSTATLYAVYRYVGSDIATVTDTIIVNSAVNSKWRVGGRNNGAQSYASKTSIQLYNQDASNPCGYIRSTGLYAGVTGVTLVATGNNANNDTLYYSTDGSSWTKWTNYCNVPSNSSAYSTKSFDMTSFPTGTYYLKIVCSKTSHYIFSVAITSKVITYNTNPDCTVDHFIDIMHDKVVPDQSGTYAMPAITGGDADKGDTYCDEKHYHFMGWVEDSDINDDGTLKAGYTLYPAGHSGHTAANKTFYAIWAKE